MYLEWLRKQEPKTFEYFNFLGVTPAQKHFKWFYDTLNNLKWQLNPSYILRYKEQLKHPYFHKRVINHGQG